MKGYRFYAEMPETRGSKAGTKDYVPFTRKYLRQLAEGRHHNNCLAVLVDELGPIPSARHSGFDAFCASTDRANEGRIELGSPMPEYLRKRCVRIDADLARRLHPNLFAFLEES